MAAKFEIKKATNGQYFFHLKSANGEIILASQRYDEKGGAKNGIASVRENAPLDERYERKSAHNGEHMFNLKAANHQVIGTSETYQHVQGRENGIAAVKRDAPGAETFDLA
ncbi:YegP family protein [Burkholderia stabilis]|uniref:YegP family protein n=1 Tax=Burkholderia stabilis TaxID=95485 RepID=UPI001F4B6D6D|nr:YegP family protein [Burkholderia stabilis]HDR9588472.1 YegP family protein [Burkholderia stabilis]HDR9652561.1 YegP family protein [Burkholderia stabilis]HDR9659013.1 YegP family protein [Burkholderia stabilis]HDR9682745.1 YegP family protein [Burkholderia stabilis]